MNHLTAQELQTMREQNEDFLLINTLNEEHFSTTQIPGSINIAQSQDDFVDQVESTANDKGQEIVLYCASEECDSSSEAGQKLEAAGFTNVFDFDSGAKGWKRAGLDLVTA